MNTAFERGAMNLCYEENRLRTFDNWKFDFIDKNKLALLGFYYIGPSDLVKCYFCNVEIGMWEKGDDILDDHIKWSPSCELILQRDTTNAPVDAEKLKHVLSSVPISIPIKRNTVSEGCIETICEEDIFMFQNNLWERYGFDAPKYCKEMMQRN